MNMVFLIFGLVLYWAVTDRLAVARSAAPAMARAAAPTMIIPPLVMMQKAAPAAERGPTSPFWSDYLTDRERDALMATAVLRTYRAGEDILHEGDDARAFCLLISGRVGYGRHLLAGTLGPGRLFAWSGLVGDHHFTATVHAELDCQVAIFPTEAVRRLCDADPTLGYHLMNEVAADIAERLHERDERLGSLVVS